MMKLVWILTERIFLLIRKKYLVLYTYEYFQACLYWRWCHKVKHIIFLSFFEKIVIPYCTNVHLIFSSLQYCFIKLKQKVKNFREKFLKYSVIQIEISSKFLIANGYTFKIMHFWPYIDKAKMHLRGTTFFFILFLFH